MNAPLISIIIPLYNAQNTIEKCLKSILKTDNAEIIIVDDFSCDKSVEIIKKLNDERIILIQNDKNYGAGYSRNRGLKEARGKYIGFVDNDDFIEENYFNEMVKKLEKTKDDICVSLKITNHTGYKIKNHLIKKDNLKRAVFIDRTAPWAKVYRKDFFDKNNIKFDLKRGEDIFPAFLESFLTDKITYIDNSSYHCRIQKGSISHKKTVEADLDEIKLYKKIVEYTDEPFYKKLIKERALISVDFLYKNAEKKLKKSVINEYKTIFNSKYPNFEYTMFKITNRINKIISNLRGEIYTASFLTK